ncbi:MAG: hypothetical protein L0332_19295 [Chloroflexi bacterium]|nr:hypothetical protein [Chloroflexota bacterium]MCI0649259.1 hypothetical protein [Chloroflexota bacterium]MCI0728843.1 hypothetical protein [Chloroflexota bacterium]
MIPVSQQPEPEDFEQSVRVKGNLFLREVPHPTSKQWEKKAYWQDALPAMRSAYNRICAYSAHWISNATGSHTIDHFVPKTADPSLAYEWSNFRYVASRFNSRKRTRTIIDPFFLTNNWFVLEFPALMVKPGPDLEPHQRQQVNDTIEILNLNDEICIEERNTWLKPFCTGKISFDFLREMAPFVAYELVRQEKVEIIAIIMAYPED